MAEEPGADLAETQPGGRGDGEGGLAKPGDLEERPQLGVRVSEAVTIT
jgi:hypothetical protein